MKALTRIGIVVGCLMIVWWVAGNNRAVPTAYAAHSIVDDFSTAIRYSPCTPGCTGTHWRSGPTGDPYMYMGTQHVSNVLGATASFSFTGHAITFGYRVTRNGGPAEIFIDGVLWERIDQYSDVRYTTSKSYLLSQGNHTITIRVASTRDVDIDYFEVDALVLPTPPPMP